jgi:hypothetical protein
MTRRPPPFRVAIALTLAVACGGGGENGAPTVEEALQATPEDAPAELVPAPSEEPGSAPLPADRVRGDPLPEEIYYSLDDYEWYRQALPIVHEGSAFAALDTVLVLSTTELDSLGRFGGVLYWGRTGLTDPDTVFVPVFEGYWLPFARAGTGS